MSSTTRSYSHGTGSGLSTNIVPTQARQQYRHLLLTTAAIFGKDFAYGGVALAVAVKPGYVLDPHYNIVAIVLSAGVFSIFGNVVAGMIAYRAYQSLRQASSTQTVLHISNPSLNGPTTSLHLRTQSQTQMEMGNIVRLNFDADLQSYGGVRTHAVKVEKEVYHYFEDDVTAKKDLQ
ncbi:hypothetical protein JAAARDRAFT_484365 [Jaapia argillacea MUCL 33604]|uniref:Uncharacterized protein n=1 Tax=Jaapia argillacea MUCL 33604 TaxID=933084 RepID=A0A067PCJ3_9AGAM|nr:hypothetical protein JAAARDRAFT_484365 [Jaapia argillacea MUCL 33604]